MGLKMRVVTTITTLVDIDDLSTEHDIEVTDEDGLSQVSQNVLVTVVTVGLKSALDEFHNQFPTVAYAAKRADDE